MTSSTETEMIAPPRAQRKISAQTDQTQAQILLLLQAFAGLISAIAQWPCDESARPREAMPTILTAPSQALQVPRPISELRTPTPTSPVRTSRPTVGFKSDRTSPALSTNTAPHAVKSSRPDHAALVASGG
jgi:hypothetical protein